MFDAEWQCFIQNDEIIINVLYINLYHAIHNVHSCGDIQPLNMAHRVNKIHSKFNVSRPRNDDQHFAYPIYRWFFTCISLQFLSNGAFNCNSALFMLWLAVEQALSQFILLEEHINTMWRQIVLLQHRGCLCPHSRKWPILTCLVGSVRGTGWPHLIKYPLES